MIDFSAYIPKSVLATYRAWTVPYNADDIASALAFAKFKEARGLAKQVCALSQSAYPCKLPEYVFQFVQIYKQTESFFNLSMYDQIKILELTAFPAHQLPRALLDLKLNGQPALRHLEQSQSLTLNVESAPLLTTDLVVFPDDYADIMPVNGLHKRDFIRIQNLYDQIISNQTRVHIEGNRNFRIRVYGHLKTLLSRKEGRELIESIVALNLYQWLLNCFPWTIHKVTIQPTVRRSRAGQKEMLPFTSPYLRVFTHTAYLSENNPSNLWTETPAGLQKHPIPDVVQLAHELIHLRHFITSRKWTAYTPKEIDGYTNAQEKVTITGILHDQVVEPISENSIRSALGFYPRRFHIA